MNPAIQDLMTKLGEVHQMLWSEAQKFLIARGALAKDMKMPLIEQSWPELEFVEWPPTRPEQTRYKRLRKTEPLAIEDNKEEMLAI